MNRICAGDPWEQNPRPTVYFPGVDWQVCWYRSPLSAVQDSFVDLFEPDLPIVEGKQSTVLESNLRLYVADDYGLLYRDIDLGGERV